MLKHSNCHAMVFRVTCGRDETSESKKKRKKKSKHQNNGTTFSEGFYLKYMILVMYFLMGFPFDELIPLLKHEVRKSRLLLPNRIYGC